MYNYNCPDCNEAKLQSDKNARKINEVIEQVNNLIQVNNETVDFIEEKANKVVEEVAELKVNEVLGDIKSSMDNKENLSNEKIRVASNPYGEGNNAVVGSIIANEGNNPRVPILTDYPPLLSTYTDRDSVAFYSGNRNRDKTLAVSGNGVVYTLNTVTVPAGVSLSLVKVGMIIDTLHAPNEFTGYIEKIEGNVITVKNGWFEKIPMTGSTEPSIPPNGVGFDIDRVTKIWANNSNIFLDANKECKKGVVVECGVFNYQNEFDEIGVYDGVSFEKAIEYIYRARARYSDNKTKYGFLVGNNIENGFALQPTSSLDVLIKSIIYKAGTKDEDGSLGFSIRADGKQNKIRTYNNSYGDGHIQAKDTDKIIFLQKNIDECFSLATPIDKSGEILIILNNASINQKIKCINDIAIISGTKQLAQVTMLPNTSALFVSNGVNWFAVIGSFLSDGYVPNTGGSFTGSISANGLTTNGSVIVTSGNITATDKNGSLKTASSSWDSGHINLGGYHLWIDSQGRLRIKNSAPTSDNDGVIVGTQV